MLVNLAAARASLGLPLGLIAQRLLLLAASVAALVAWLQWVVAPSAMWFTSARTCLTLITTPWQLGLAIPGISVFWAWLAGIYVSVRGLFIGVRVPSGGDARHWFSLGAIVLVSLFALMARAGLGDAQLPSEQLRSVTLGYFVIGLSVVAFDQRRSVFRREGVRPTHALAFVWAVALPIASVVGAAVILVGGAEAMRWLAATLAHASSVIAHWIWQIVLWLAHALHSLLEWLGGLSGAAPSSESSPTGAGDPSDTGSEPWIRRRAIQLRVPTEALPALLAIAGVVWFGLFVAALLRKREREREPTEPLQEESVSLWSLALLGQQLRSLCRGWVSAMHAQRSALAARFLPQPKAAEAAPEEPHDVRAIYRVLLGWAARRGHPRAKTVTPLEFARQLAHAELAPRQAIETLTSYYEYERYGAKVIDADQLAHAQDLLRRLTTEASQPPTLDA